MATVKFILHRPYLKDKYSNGSEYHSTGENRTERTKQGKKRKTKKLVDHEVRLYAVLIVRMGEVVKIKTEYTILPEKWDFEKQQLKDNIRGIDNKPAIEFNNKLLQLKSEILDKYAQTVTDHPDMTFTGIYQILKDFGKKKEIPYAEKGEDLFAILDQYIEFLKGEVTFRTAQKYTTLKNSLKDFGSQEKYRKYQNLSFSQIDFRFKDAYTKYLRSQKPRGRMKSRPEDDQKGILIDTEGKYIECLKTFCRWSEERGYNNFTTYRQFKNFSDAHRKLRKPKNEIITLTIDELETFYTHDFRDRPSLDRVRDLFCFAAYTGQRWSDIERFSKDDLKGDVWSFTAYKTKKQTSIDLIGYAAPALDILKKYDYKLPEISLVKFNKYIKDAAGIAGINSKIRVSRYRGADEISIEKPKFKFISSHSARKTCISILLNEFNIPISHVMQISGHSDLKTLMVYINKDNQSRRSFMAKTGPRTETLMKVAK